MDIFKINIFRGSLFKQAKFLVSTPQIAQTAFYISEAGTISKELLPMHTGFMCPPTIKKAWVVIHSLKHKIFKKGLPVSDIETFVISDRSYIPLDPHNTMKKSERERLTSLKDIAKMRHSEARSEVHGGHSDKTDTANVLIYVSGVLMFVFALIFIIAKAIS